MAQPAMPQKMMHARMVCREGHVLDALAIYDSIARSIIPNPVQTGRMRPSEIQSSDEALRSPDEIRRCVSHFTLVQTRALYQLRRTPSVSRLDCGPPRKHQDKTKPSHTMSCPLGEWSQSCSRSKK